MSKTIKIAENIHALRKKYRVTQEQLAEFLNVSPQAVSKWENGACQPDTDTIARIADYFHVSIDYLFYGTEKVYDDILEKNISFIRDSHMNRKNSLEEMIKISVAAQQGLIRGMEEDCFKSRGTKHQPVIFSDLPLHVTTRTGLSVSTPKGFSAVVTKGFLNSIDGIDMKRAMDTFQILSDEDCLHVIVEILNFNGISHMELKEKTQFEEERLQKALKKCLDERIIESFKSPHAILGYEYFVDRFYYNCLC